MDETTDAPEHELIGRAAEGDLVAFERLHRAHSGRIYGLCVRLCADADRARDLTQESFARAWRGLGEFRRESGLGTWLHRIATNVFLEDQRRRGRREGHEEGVEDEQLGRAPAPVSSQEAGLDLERAISRLPQGARTVFVLHDVEGYRHEEIATNLGLSVGTTKAQLHRARRLLREALA